MSGRLNETIEALRRLLQAVQDPVVDNWDPIELGLLIAKLEYEDLDVAKQRAFFDDLVSQARVEFPEAAPLKDQAAYLGRTFTEKLGFQGDRANYYNIKNSFLNDVFLRRKGIPITMSLVYMGLCRALGVKAVGIGFPGHFLVRVLPGAGQFDVENWREQWFVDAFDGGKVLSVADCETRLNEWTRGVVAFGPEVLKPAHPVDILSRVLRNLRAIFAEKEDLPRLYWVLSALIELSPSERIEAFRERGFIYARMARYQEATSDLRRYLGLCKDPQKVAHVEQLLRHFESRANVLN
jgi:regulator of sirC expression with transglutaminase-like and TPR domain